MNLEVNFMFSYEPFSLFFDFYYYTLIKCTNNNGIFSDIIKMEVKPEVDVSSTLIEVK